jgi:hypothetical protein
MKNMSPRKYIGPIRRKNKTKISLSALLLGCILIFLVTYVATQTVFHVTHQSSLPTWKEALEGQRQVRESLTLPVKPAEAPDKK